MLPLPTVHAVRLATPEDLPRISLVAAAAFFWSPSFQFQRPRYRDFPTDTIASYLLEYEATLKDPTCAVLVAEDVLKEDEAQDVYEALRFAYGLKSPRQKGIVGVCSLKLKPNSSYVGHFQSQNTLVGVAGSDTTLASNTAAGLHIFPGHLQICNLKRDQCAVAIAQYNTVTAPAKLEHLEGKMRLSTLAVAPSYWRRGHASRLVSFCTQLADLDDALLGISATLRGQTVVEKAGFQEREVTHVTLNAQLGQHAQAAREAPSDVHATLWIGVRLPCSRSSSRGTQSRAASPTDSQ